MRQPAFGAVCVALRVNVFRDDDLKFGQRLDMDVEATGATSRVNDFNFG